MEKNRRLKFMPVTHNQRLISKMKRSQKTYTLCMQAAVKYQDMGHVNITKITLAKLNGSKRI